MQFKSPQQILTVFLLMTLLSCTLLEEIKRLDLDCHISSDPLKDWLKQYDLTFDPEKKLLFRDQSFYVFGLTSYVFARVNQPKVQYRYMINQQIPHYEQKLLSKIPINNINDLEDWLFNTPEKEKRDYKTKKILYMEDYLISIIALSSMMRMVKTLSSIV